MTAPARGLDAEDYCPVIVRDTEQCFEPPPAEFDGLLLCPIAALNLQLRMALYELSWLNLTVPNGPGELCRLSDTVRYLYFRVVDDSSETTSKILIASQGIEIDGQLPHATPFQRLVWEPDDRAVIEREFTAMAEIIGDAGAPVPLPADAGKSRDPMETAVQLQMTGRAEEATSIYQEIVQDDPDNADAWHMLGIIAHQAERPEVAEKMIMRAIELNQEQANYFVSIAPVMRDLDRGEEALNALRRAIAIDPDDAGAHADLAELLLADGNAEQAQSEMMTALKSSPHSIELYERAARMLDDLGNVEEAARFYRRAIDVREEIAAKAREATGHMSEIPQVTLKSG